MYGWKWEEREIWKDKSKWHAIVKLCVRNLLLQQWETRDVMYEFNVIMLILRNESYISSESIE